MNHFDAIPKNISGVEPRPDSNLRRGSPLPHPPPFGANPSASLVTCASPGSGGSGFAHADSPKIIHFPWWFKLGSYQNYSIVGSVMAYEEKETSYVVRNASGKTVVVALRETVASFTDTVSSPV